MRAVMNVTEDPASWDWKKIELQPTLPLMRSRPEMSSVCFKTIFNYFFNLVQACLFQNLTLFLFTCYVL